MHWKTYIEEIINKKGNLERAIKLVVDDIGLQEAEVRAFANAYLYAIEKGIDNK